MAASVAKFTVAATSSIVLSFFSTRAAHAAQVIPWTDNFISWGADDASPVTAVDDTEVILSSSKNLAHHSAGSAPGTALSARTAPDLPLAPGAARSPAAVPGIYTSPKPDRSTKGPTCNLFAFGKYPARVPRIPPGGFPDTPVGFIDPFPSGSDIRISGLCGRPAANYHQCHHAPARNPGPAQRLLRDLTPRPPAQPAARRQGVSEVAGPSWLTGAFAGVMILAACYSASRLVVSRLRELGHRGRRRRTARGHGNCDGRNARALSCQPAATPRHGWWCSGPGRRGSAHAPLRSRNQSQVQLAVPVPGPAPDRMHRHAVHARGRPRGAAGDQAWRCPAWAPPPAQRRASRLWRWSWPCSCWATSCGPPTSWPPWPAPGPAHQARTGATRSSGPWSPSPVGRPRRQPQSALQTAPHAAAGMPHPGLRRPSGAPHARARRVRQDRDGRHHGLHAHPHALIGPAAAPGSGD